MYSFARSVRVMTVLLAAGLASACASTGSPVSAVRFHQGFTAQAQTVALRPADPALAGSLEFTSYAQAVGARLEALGFRPEADAAKADIIGQISYSSARREGRPGESPVSIGVGVGGVGSNVGISLGTRFGLGERKSTDELSYGLAVRLISSADGKTLWEGRAEIDQADSGGASLSAAMPQLIDGLFAQFPGPSGVTTKYTSRK